MVRVLDKTPLEESWQATSGLLGRWDTQGRRTTPRGMPIWQEPGGAFTLCAACRTLLRLNDAPWCAGCRAKNEAAKRAARKGRKRAKMRTRREMVG